MANAKIKFIGTTSSGRGYKYELIADTEAKLTASKTALEGAGVVFNENLGVVGFISQTHLYSTKNIGDSAEVDIKGYEDDRGRQINWFAGIDKNKQKAFADNKKTIEDVNAVVMVENALTDANSGLDVYKFEQIRLLKLQQAKLAKEIALIASAD